jgi:hypothetical protein
LPNRPEHVVTQNRIGFNAHFFYRVCNFRGGYLSQFRIH